MHLTSERLLDGGTLERRFTLNGIPGILWTPPHDPAASVPLILMGHPGGLDALHPRLAGRARRSAADGFATATLELPGAGARAPIPDVDTARDDLRRALAAGDPVPAEVVDRLVLPLVERAVPEWQAAMDALLAHPGIDGPVGFSGGVTAIAVRLAVVDPRIRAAGLFAGSYVPAATLTDAARLNIPVHMLLQWDDHGNDRQQALDLFDALGSSEKTLEANLGGHTGIPAFAGESAARFFVRHLRGARV